MVQYGTKLFGKVDQVPGLFYVATQFHFVGAFPLLPTGSWLVLEGTENETDLNAWWESEQRSIQEFRGVPIPWSGRSILAGYLRTPLAWIGGIIVAAAIATMLMVEEPANSPVAAMALGLAILAIPILHRLFCSHANLDRALALARAVELPGEIVAEAMGIPLGSRPADGLPASR